MLNVFLNTNCLLDYHKTGIPYYTWHLLKGMMVHQEIDYLYTFAGHRLMKYRPAKSPNKISRLDEIYNFFERKPFFKKIVAMLCRNNVENFTKKKLAQDIIYVEPNFIVESYEGPCITTLHDLTCLRFPQLQPAQRVLWFEKGLQKTLNQAKHIISVSEFTRQEAIRFLGLSPEKITTIHNGVSPLFRPRDTTEVNEVLKKYHVHYKQYILSVGTLEPRKNLNSLLDGYLRLPQSMRRQYPLVLVGAVGWKVQDLMRKIKNKPHDVQVLGYLPQNELAAIFSGAAVFSYLSTYEGFGLPVLEALASGVPVLTSNDSAMMEFSHQQALLVNPLDISAITKGLQALLTDKTRAQLALNLADSYRENFSWQKCVNKTVELIKHKR